MNKTPFIIGLGMFIAPKIKNKVAINIRIGLGSCFNLTYCLFIQKIILFGIVMEIHKERNSFLIEIKMIKILFKYIN